MSNLDDTLRRIVQEESARRDPQLAVQHFSLGEEALKAQRYEEARGHFQIALNWDANDKYYSSLGESYLGLERLDKAVESFNEAIKLNPKNTEPSAEFCYNFGLTLEKKQDLECAINAFSKAIEFDPNNAQAHYKLGRITHQIGDATEAIDQYKEAIRLGLNNADIHYWFGLALDKKGDKEKAINELKTAIELDKFNPVYHETLANNLNNTGMKEEALEEYQLSIKLGRENAFIHTQIGSIFEKKGRVQEAIKHYKNALKIEPSNSVAKNKLESLPKYYFQIVIGHIRGMIKKETNRKEHVRYSIQGEVTGILDQLVTLTHRFPDFIDAYQMLAAIHTLGGTCGAHGTLNEAERYIKTCKRLTTRSDVPHLKINEFVEGGYWYAIGLLKLPLTWTRGYGKAIEHWTKAQGLDPKNIYLPKNEDIGVLKDRASKYDGAFIFHFPKELTWFPPKGGVVLFDYLVHYLINE